MKSRLDSAGSRTFTIGDLVRDSLLVYSTLQSLEVTNQWRLPESVVQILMSMPTNKILADTPQRVVSNFSMFLEAFDNPQLAQYA